MKRRGDESRPPRLRDVAIWYAFPAEIGRVADTLVFSVGDVPPHGVTTYAGGRVVPQARWTTRGVWSEGQGVRIGPEHENSLVRSQQARPK